MEPRDKKLTVGKENMPNRAIGAKTSIAENGSQSKLATEAKKSATGKDNTGKIAPEEGKSTSGNVHTTKIATEANKSIYEKGNITTVGPEPKKSITGTENHTKMFGEVKKSSGRSEKSSKTTTEVKLSSTGQHIFECGVCHQHFPYPMNYPENHSVVPFQCSDFHNTEPFREGQGGQTPALKSRSGNIVSSSLATRPHFLFYNGKTAVNIIMGGEIPIFPKARSMFIHSGNIINWNRLKRKPNQSSSEEICEIIGKTLSSFLEREDKTQLQYVTEIYKVNSENVQQLAENERDEVKISVKLFVFMPQPASVISEAVNKVLNELGTTFVETLLLAVIPASGADEDSLAPSWNMIQPYWEEMEELVSADKVLSLGICDLAKDELEDLYNSAKVKPSIDQVNLQSCCLLPHDLTEYAKSVDVQLLTHNDRPVLISEEELHETIQNVSTEPDSNGWSPQWVVRYSGILKCQSIIKTKAYIMHARRGNRKLIL